MEKVLIYLSNENSDLIGIIKNEIITFLSKYVEIFFNDSLVKSDYVISFNNNNIFNGELSHDSSLKGRAFSITTIGNVYYIDAGTNYGLLFGLYRLMHHLIGFEVFGDDEISLDNDIVFKEVNEKCVPDIPFASRSWMADKYTNLYSLRLGYCQVNWLVENFHSFISFILPKEKYFKEHPDWYAKPSTRQLCLTNDEMTNEFIKNTISYLNDKNLKDGDYFVLRLGHEDNTEYCTCDKCKESDEKYSRSGTLMRFINKVAKAVNEYAEKNYPDKVIKIETFGYSFTVNPPVKDDNTPIDESVVLEKNVGIFSANMAPYWANEYDSFVKNLKGWAAINAELYIWLYDSIFDDEFIFLNTLVNTQNVFKQLKKANTIYLEDMGHNLANVSFDAFSNYLRSKLSWDVNANIDELKDRFFSAYYKEAKNDLLTYYEEICECESSFLFEKHCYTKANYEFREKESWDKETLIKWFELLTKSIDKVEEKVKLRIARERLTPLYLLLEIYAKEIEKDDLKKYIDYFANDCAKNNILYYAEHGAQYSLDLQSKLVCWRSLL